MFEESRVDSTDKPSFYRELAAQMTALLSGESDEIANAANAAALIFQAMPELNWAGFYFLRSPQELVVGPFQGKPACVRIAVGRGVCGTAVAERRSIRVHDVTEVENHIFCDPDLRSELVVPLIRHGAVLGVLDLDSPVPGRFDADDQAGVERLVAIYLAACGAAEGAQ
ncbi:GAF domain-containing protein [Aquamicrobium lusatiense]|uniref:GAF domain-containing protein n=1 Tax=Aquamicrobium lusatiense TaxID=89772 RepID=UPI0024581C28|nr:GAF domain-containing protein [Aquamicrobium lusatiense]MDH4991865.1 GAF domain-containing protein [Aquamicrobium lusatiense]